MTCRAATFFAVVLAAVSLAPSALASGYSDAVLRDGPVAYWRLGEAGGTVVRDASGHGNDATVEGVVQLGRPGAIAGDGDTSFLFDGTARVRFDRQLLSRTDDLTLEAWVQPRLFERPGHVLYVGDSARGGYGALLSNGGCLPANDVHLLVGAVTCRGTAAGAGSISTTEWSHLVVTRSSGTWTIYVNGDARATGTVAPIAPSAFAEIGRGVSGYVDEAAVYDHALSAAQVREHYLAALGAPAPPPPPLAGAYAASVVADAPAVYWRLNDHAAPTAVDSGGRSLAGRYVGGVAFDQAGATGDGDSAVVLDGTTGRITGPLATTRAANVTLELWVKWLGGAGRSLLLYNGNSGANGYGLMISAGPAGGFACGIGDSAFVLIGGVSCDGAGGGVQLPTGAWVHLAAVLGDGGVWTLYGNGVARASGFAPPRAPAAPGGLAVGKEFDGSGGSDYLRAVVDDVAVYESALAPERVAAHYAASGQAAAGGAPVNIALPRIDGSAGVDESVQADRGSWNGASTYTYQWQRCTGTGCADIAGATGLTYTPGNADEGADLLFRVLARNASGSTLADSARIAVGSNRILYFVPGIGGSVLGHDNRFDFDFRPWPNAIVDAGSIPSLALEPDGVTSVDRNIVPLGILERANFKAVYKGAVQTFRRWACDPGSEVYCLSQPPFLKDYVGFDYDWRVGVGIAGFRLADALARRCGEGRIWLVGHSTGGLVIKAALRSLRTLGIVPETCFGKGGVIFIATPHLGAPKAEGSLVNPDLFFEGDKIAQWSLNATMLAPVLNNFLTAWQLAPRADINSTLAGFDWYADHRVKPAQRPREPWFSRGRLNIAGGALNFELDTGAEITDDLHNNRARTVGTLPVYNLFSASAPTKGSYAPGGDCYVEQGQRKYRNIATDVHLDYLTRGDLTVPGWSSTWPGAGLDPQSQYEIGGVAHSALPNDAAVLDLVRAVVGAGNPRSYPNASRFAHGASALEFGHRAPLNWTVGTCSPVRVTAHYAGASIGQNADGEVVGDLTDAAFDVAGAPDDPETTIAIAATPPNAPPSYELTAIGDGRVGVWAEDPDGNESLFAFAVRRGDTAVLRSDAGAWTVTVDHGADGSVDERLAANGPDLTFTAPAQLAEGEAGDLAADLRWPAPAEATYAWSIVRGAATLAADGPRATLSADDGPATVRVRLSVTDASARSTVIERDVEIANVAPKVSVAPVKPAPWGTPVALSGDVGDAGSADRAAGLSPRWEFGDGTGSDGTTAAHVYARPGSFSAVLSARDKDGATGSQSAAVTITSRMSSLRYTGAATASFGPLRLPFALVDGVDPATAQLAGLTVVVTVDGAPRSVTTDAAGVALLDLPLPLGLGAHTLEARLAATPLYDAAPVSATLTIVNSVAKLTGGAKLDSGVQLSIVAMLRGDDLSGELQLQTPAQSLHAHAIDALGVAASGDVWFSAHTDAGVRILGRARPGGAGTGQLEAWVDGTRLPGTPALVAGTLQLH